MLLVNLNKLFSSFCVLVPIMACPACKREQAFVCLCVLLVNVNKLFEFNSVSEQLDRTNRSSVFSVALTTKLQNGNLDAAKWKLGCLGFAKVPFTLMEKGSRVFKFGCETNMAPFMPFRVILVIK